MIRKHPLATVVINTSAGLCAHHIPLRLIRKSATDIVLQGHIAHANPLWKESADDVLAIFQGANGYISPHWYPTKKEHGRVVPTWNYVAVHASGLIQFIHERHWKINFLQALTSEHESNQETPWAISDAPEAFIDQQLSSIVGFEIAVYSLNGKWKLSQNQVARNKQGAIDGLSKDAKELAEVMKESVSTDETQ